MAETRHETATRVRRSKRPFGVTLAAWVVLILAVVGWVRFFRTIADWEFLKEILPISPAYLAGTGFLWGAAGGVVGLGLLLGRRRAPLAALIFAGLFSVYYWLERVVLFQFSDRAVNWIFMAGLNLVWVVWMIWIFMRPKVRSFFEKSDEQRAENQTIT